VFGAAIGFAPDLPVMKPVLFLLFFFFDLATFPFMIAVALWLRRLKSGRILPTPFLKVFSSPSVHVALGRQAGNGLPIAVV